MKYLVYWKRFTAKNNTWKKEEDLENAKELVNKCEGRMNAEFKWQEELRRVRKVKLNPRTEEVRRSELLKRYTAKLLFGWDDRKLEKNWQRWKLVSLEEKS